MKRAITVLVLGAFLAVLSSTPVLSEGPAAGPGAAPVAAAPVPAGGGASADAATLTAGQGGSGSSLQVGTPSLTGARPLAGQRPPAVPSPGEKISNGATAAVAIPPATAVAPTPSPWPGTTTTPVFQVTHSSAIEQAMTEDLASSQPTTPQKFAVGGIAQFGYSFFRGDAGAFAPLTDVPVGPDYLVGVGDRLVITAWGSLEGSFELEVNRSGEIVLPKVGAIQVLGTPYGQLTDLIKSRLATVYKDFQLNVNLGKLRMIKVYVVGEVASPGDYTITSLSTLINALSAAGGPTKNGTLRNIQIRRNGKLVDTVDLYDFFLKGDKSRDIRLQPGDTIFVPVIGPVAGIAGNVRRPAIYELNSERTLKDLLELAGGLIPTGYLQRVQVARILPHDKKVVSDFSIDPKDSGTTLNALTGAIALQDMDLVKIFPISNTLRGYARLDGYVLRPGDYALKPGMRVADLLLPDNLLPEYFSGSAQLTRLHGPDFHPEVTFINVGKALAGDPTHNLELREFDVIRLFSRWELEEMPKVRVSGEVQKPGEFRLFPNMTVRDLLLLGGNPKLTAYLKQAELARIRKNGDSVTSFPIRISIAEALKGNPEHNLPLEPFDELSVRRIPNWSEETERYITLQGEFVFPGTYPVFKGERLSSVIARAGGFTDKAYLRGARFTREPVRQLQQKRMEEVIARTEEEILRKSAELSAVAASKEELEATRAALESLRRSVELLKTKKAEGRVVIALSPPGELAKGPYDVELTGGDTLYVPQDPKVVSVLGQVYNPTSFIHIPGRDAKNYLSLAGGPTREADEGEIYLVRVDGTVISKKQAVFWFFNNLMSQDLDSGDTVVVPQRFEKIAWMRDIKDIATILGQLALTAGVIVAAGL